MCWLEREGPRWTTPPGGAAHRSWRVRRPREPRVRRLENLAVAGRVLSWYRRVDREEATFHRWGDGQRLPADRLVRSRRSRRRDLCRRQRPDRVRHER